MLDYHVCLMQKCLVYCMLQRVDTHDDEYDADAEGICSNDAGYVYA